MILNLRTRKGPQKEVQHALSGFYLLPFDFVRRFYFNTINAISIELCIQILMF
jgi:hypothetical protein